MADAWWRRFFRTPWGTLIEGARHDGLTMLLLPQYFRSERDSVCGRRMAGSDCASGSGEARPGLELSPAIMAYPEYIKIKILIVVLFKKIIFTS